MTSVDDATIEKPSQDVIRGNAAACATKLEVFSMFSGAGGFDLGFDLHGGYRHIFANELKDAPCETLAQHFFSGECRETSAVVRKGDLPVALKGNFEQVDLSGLRDLEPDVLIGGPPCQEFSVMQGQHRKGIEVKGGRLYHHFVKAIAELKPKVFVFENVPGLVSANKKQAYEEIQKHLSEPVGMLKTQARELVQNEPELENVAYETLFNGLVNASDLGVPQSRRRLIIIGLRSDLAAEIDTFSLAALRNGIKHRLEGRGNLFNRYPMTCLEIFEGRPLTELTDRYDKIMSSYKTLVDDMDEHAKTKKWVSKTFSPPGPSLVRDYLREGGVTRSLFHEDEFEQAMEEHREVLNKLGYLGRPVEEQKPDDGTGAVSEVSDSVQERMYRTPPGENYAFTSGTDWHVEGKGLSLIYRRPHPLSPAPTVVAYGGGGTYGYHYDRSRDMLTNRERARLQTFTDDFLFSGGVSEARQQIGEAVPPLMACRIAGEIESVLREL